MYMKIKILLSIVLLITNVSYGSDIKGKIILSSSAKSQSKGLSALYQKSAEKYRDTSKINAVIFINEYAGMPAPTPVLGAELSQKNISFVPHVIAITAGSTVKFPNMDKVYHNVFSLSKNAEFDLGRYKVGKSQSFQFNKPARVEVYCEIHSNMAAHIIVVPNNNFAISDEDGYYEIKNLPPGDYTLSAWVEGFPLKEIRITVPSSGDLLMDIKF